MSDFKADLSGENGNDGGQLFKAYRKAKSLTTRGINPKLDELFDYSKFDLWQKNGWKLDSWNFVTKNFKFKESIFTAQLVGKELKASIVSHVGVESSKWLSRMKFSHIGRSSYSEILNYINGR